MTIGQAKAKPYWLALCLTDVFIKLFIIFFGKDKKTIDSSKSFYYLCIGFSKIIYVLLSFSLGSTV